MRLSTALAWEWVASEQIGCLSWWCYMPGAIRFRVAYYVVEPVIHYLVLLLILGSSHEEGAAGRSAES